MSGLDNVESTMQATTSPAEEAPAPAAVETDAQQEAPEGEAEAEAPGEEAAQPETTTEPEEVRQLRAQMQELAPLAELGRQLLQERAREQPQAPSGPDGKLLKAALKLLVEPGMDPAKREAAFSKFPLEVQEEAARRLRSDDEDALERLADPEGWAEKRFGGLIQKALAPVVQRFALDQFERNYPDLQSKEDRAAIGALVKAGAPIHFAVEHLRLLKERTLPASNTQRAAAEDDRAVREARKRAAPPKGGAPKAKKIPVSGFYYEDVLRDLAQAEDQE